MQPSHSKLKLANLCWQTQVGVCERHKNSRQTRFYLTPTVCKHVCHLFWCRSHTPTSVCQHEFANLSLPCEGRLSPLPICKFRNPSLVTFYLCMYLTCILNKELFTFHLQYKHSGMFANRKSFRQNCLTSKIRKCTTPF